jgi:hypothetical protein
MLDSGGAGRNLGHVFVLDIDDVPTATGAVCDVYVDTSIDGSNWLTIVHFPQLSTATKHEGAQFYEQVWGAAAAAGFTSTAAAPAAGNVNAILGRVYRCRYTRSPGATVTTSFTFAVHAF